ncbi:hypothetical protein EVA_14793 [gut metagenome]|uniref:Uncharacterized protein n=1 Tax=gut metagenome TaxID=749906 RepID=J9G5N5_9ZZZZ
MGWTRRLLCLKKKQSIFVRKWIVWMQKALLAEESVQNLQNV